MSMVTSQQCIRDGSNEKLPELPQSINPFTLTSSGRVRFISADSTIAAQTIACVACRCDRQCCCVATTDVPHAYDMD